MLYRIRDWNTHFENSRSREIDHCSFVAVKNKQHGLGFTFILSQPDGAAILGIWYLIVEACSLQKRPRQGYLTDSGSQDGRCWNPKTMALRWRRNEAEIQHALDVLCSPDVDWIECVSAQVSPECRPSADVLPTECRSTAVGTEQNRSEQNRTISRDAVEVSGPKDECNEADIPELTGNGHAQPTDDEKIEMLYEAYPRKVDPRAAKKAIKAALKRAPYDIILAGVKRFAASREGQDKSYTKYPATFFNADAWENEPDIPPNGFDETGEITMEALDRIQRNGA